MVECPESLPVELNLEESGTLCRLMMQEEEFRKACLTGKTNSPIIVRWVKLYAKLAEVNDKLMGKL